MRISDWSSDVCSSDLRAMIGKESARVHVRAEWLSEGDDIGRQNPHHRNAADEIEARDSFAPNGRLRSGRPLAIIQIVHRFPQFARLAAYHTHDIGKERNRPYQTCCNSLTTRRICTQSLTQN